METSRAVERAHPPRVPFDLVNRVVSKLLVLPGVRERMGRHLLLLGMKGRKTGRSIVVPVAYRTLGDGRLLVLTNSTWRVNLRPRAGVQVTLRGVERRALATIDEDPESVARTYRRLLGEVGRKEATRRLGLRINVDRDPTLEELREAAEHDHLSVIHLTLDAS